VDDREGAVRRRHFDYFVALAEPWADYIGDEIEPDRSHPLLAENTNLDAARRWAVERGDAAEALHVMHALDLFWAYAVPPRPRRLERLATVLALPYDSTQHTVVLDRAWACHTAGQLSMKVPAHARTWFEESLDLFRVLGHASGESAALRGLMEAALRASELETAEAYNNDARAIVRQIDNRKGEAWTIYQDGMLALARHQPDQAEVCGHGARNIFEEVASDYGIFSSDFLLGEALYAQGRYAEAVAAYGSAAAIQIRTGFVRDVEDLLEDLAIIAAALGAYQRAAELFGAAATWRAVDADPRVPYTVADYRAATAASRRSLGPRRWQAAFDVGARLTGPQAMGLARAAVDELAVLASAHVVGLTARERQVLELVAQGSRDQEVADLLQLSRRTVHAHLRSVYAKLDVTTRTAAVHRATELGLLDSIPH
jgi:DNA-binding CsgD family transcriptional regulator